jgi:hypothetical protein
MATMTLDRGGGTLSVKIAVGPLQKTFWSVSKRSPQAGGGYGDWHTVSIFDDQSGGAVNQTVAVGDCANLIGSQISIVFFVARVNFSQADPYRIAAEFFCASNAPIAGKKQADSGNLDQTHIVEQFDFVVAAA